MPRRHDVTVVLVLIGCWTEVNHTNVGTFHTLYSAILHRDISLFNCTAFTQIPLTETHTHPFNGPFSGSTRVSRYQKGKTNLDFTEARDSGIRWAICKSAPRSRQITTSAPHHSSFLQAGCPSCQPTNSIKALKALSTTQRSGHKSGSKIPKTRDQF